MDRELQQDLPTMPPEQQLEAMGLAPQAGAAAEPEDQQPESQAEVTIEPEIAAYEAEQATAEAPTTTRAGKRQRKG